MGPHIDRQFSNRIGRLAGRSNLYAQPIARLRPAEQAVVHGVPGHGAVVDRQHGIRELHARGFRFRLDGYRAPIRVAEMERGTDVFAAVPYQVDVIRGVACEGRHRQHEQRGQRGIRQPVSAET
jgi:hypothetical protein